MTGQHSRTFQAAIVLVTLLALASMACNLTKQDDAQTSSVADVSTPPSVVIRNAPTTAAIGQPITIEVEATDPSGRGVTRIELKINEITVDQKASPDPNGTTPFLANLTWSPVRVGNIIVQVVAWRGSVAGQSNTLQLTVGNTPVATASLVAGGGNVTPVAPTVGPCRARVDVGALNFRSVPDASNDAYIIKAFGLNEEPLIVGRLADSSWYLVQDTTSPQVGWVSAGYVTVLGTCGSVRVESPPATPTLAPTNTLPPSAEPHPADLVALPISGRVSLQLDQSNAATESYSLMIQNVGGQDSGQFQVQIVLPGGQEVIKTVNNLAAGQTLNVADGDQQSVTFTTPGTQRISVHVDFANQVTESNEGNNITLLDITVEAAPAPTEEQVNQLGVTQLNPKLT